MSYGSFLDQSTMFAGSGFAAPIQARSAAADVAALLTPGRPATPDPASMIAAYFPPVAVPFAATTALPAATSGLTSALAALIPSAAPTASALDTSFASVLESALTGSSSRASVSSFAQADESSSFAGLLLKSLLFGSGSASAASSASTSSGLLESLVTRALSSNSTASVSTDLSSLPASTISQIAELSSLSSSTSSQGDPIFTTEFGSVGFHGSKSQYKGVYEYFSNGAENTVLNAQFIPGHGGSYIGAIGGEVGDDKVLIKADGKVTLNGKDVKPGEGFKLEKTGVVIDGVEQSGFVAVSEDGKHATLNTGSRTFNLELKKNYNNEKNADGTPLLYIDSISQTNKAGTQAAKIDGKTAHKQGGIIGFLSTLKNKDEWNAAVNDLENKWHDEFHVASGDIMDVSKTRVWGDDTQKTVEYKVGVDAEKKTGATGH